MEIVKQWRLPGKQARVFGCQDCGLLFVHPQPAPEVLDAYYAPDGGWQESRHAESRKPPRTRSPQTRKKGAAPALLAALDGYFPATRSGPGARIFDFGCGTGTWLNSFQDAGWETFGLEPCSADAFIRHQRLLEIPWLPEFDLVLAYHVLEHLPRPLDTLHELARAIRPGGYLLASVPRLDTLAVHRQVDYCLHPRHHIGGFTEACLRGLLARAGLGVVAALHDLDDRFSKGVPLRLRLLARKGETPVAANDPASALTPVIEAFVTVTGGPARTFWNPANRVMGNYTAKATFNLMKPSGHISYYGLVFGGQSLEGAAQKYLYFLVAQNGTYIIRARTGEAVTDVRASTPHAAIRQPGADGRSTNAIEVRVAAGTISYVVNGTVVHTTPRTGATAATDGIAGVRVNHVLDVMVDAFEVQRQ